MRRLALDLIGAALIVCAGVILLLSYFDVLTK